MSQTGSGRRPEWQRSWSDAPASKSRLNLWLVVLLAIAIPILGAGLATALFSVTTANNGSSVWIAVGSIVGVVVAVSATITSTYILNRRSSPTSVRIAILGMPQVGKTTLITACFQEIFSRRVNLQPVMSGTRSFEHLNENISRLSAGLTLTPTRDQDVAAYRFEVTPSRLLAPRYRVEFGDFPGEDTERYVKEYGPWLHGTPFFEWALTCDSFAFCVDSGPLVKHYKMDNRSSAENAALYIAQSSATVRAAWQNIVASFDSRRIAYLRRSPVLLAFTKADLLLRTADQQVESGIPAVIHIPEHAMDEVQNWLRGQFADLINYFQGETKNFSTVATSAFAMSEAGRVGINEFLHGVLPAQAFSHASVSASSASPKLS